MVINIFLWWTERPLSTTKPQGRIMTEKIRDSFIFYRSFFQAAKKLPKEDRAELMDAICYYALDGEEIDLSVVPEAIFTVIQPNLDANRRRWENGCKEKKPTRSKPEAKGKQTRSKPEGNKDKDVDVNKDVKCKSEFKSELINDKYKLLAEGLVFVLESKLNKSFTKSTAKSWATEIRLLIESDLKNRVNAFDDVKNAIQVVGDNYGADYFPVIQSGKSLREKLGKIENFVARNKPKKSGIHEAVDKLMAEGWFDDEVSDVE